MNELLMSLAVLEKNMSLYPSGHAAIQIAMERFMGALNVAFDQMSSVVDKPLESHQLTLTTQRDQMLVNGQAVDIRQNNQQILTLIQSFMRYGIVSVTIGASIQAETIEEFFNILHKLPPKTSLDEAPLAYKSIQGLKNISVAVVNWSSIQYSEGYQSDSKSNVLNHLLASWAQSQDILRDQASPREDLSIDDFNEAERQKIRAFKQFMIDNHLTDEDVMKAYELSIKTKFKIEPQVPISDHDDDFSLLETIMPLVSTELRQKMAATTLDLASHEEDLSRIEQIMSNLPSALLVEALDQAQQNQMKVSPALTELLTIITVAKLDVQSQSQSQQVVTDTFALNSTDVDSLIKREAYEDYVNQGYSSDLEVLTKDQGRNWSLAENYFPLEEIVDDFNYRRTNQHLCVSLLQLLINNVNYQGHDYSEPEYKEFAQQITINLQLLVEVGDFYLLDQIHATFKKHSEVMPSPYVRQAALQALKAFTDLDMCRLIQEAFTLHWHHKDRMLLLEKLILACGSAHISGLIDLYLDDSEGMRSDLIVSIFKNMGTALIQHIQMRIENSDLNQVLSLARLLNRINNGMANAGLRLLLDHKWSGVQEYALLVLLKKKDKMAIDKMRHMLASAGYAPLERLIGILIEAKVRLFWKDLFEMMRCFYITPSGVAKNDLLIKGIAGIMARGASIDEADDFEAAKQAIEALSGMMNKMSLTPKRWSGTRLTTMNVLKELRGAWL